MKKKPPKLTERQVEISLALVEDPESQAIPILKIARHLESLQRLVLAAGQAASGGGVRGSWRHEVTEFCELTYAGRRDGSLVFAAELPPPPPNLFAAEEQAGEDLGSKALDLVTAALKAVEEESYTKLTNLGVDDRKLLRLLGHVDKLTPADPAELEITFRTAKRSAKLTSEARTFVSWAREMVSVRPPQEDRAKLKGELIRIQVGSERHLTVRVGSRDIKCLYESDFEDLFRGLVAGSIVNVEGRAILSEDATIVRLEDVINAYPLETGTLHMKHVTYDGRVYYFSRSLPVQVDWADGLWLFSMDELSITANGETRQEAQEAFEAELALLYQVYATSEDEELMPDAKELAGALRKMIARVEDAVD